MVTLDCSKEPIAVVYRDVNVVPEHNEEGLELTISRLQAEISELRLKQKCLEMKRRESLDKILDIKGCIRVFGRVRSSLSTNNSKTQSPISTEPEKITVRSMGSTKEFGLDRVFPQEATQDDIYSEVDSIVRSALDGHNVCMLAYGQTGTGKTFTMEGTSDKPGLVPRAIEELFHRASQGNSTSFTFSMSMLEVYMGGLRDLLVTKRSSSRAIESAPKCGLSILSDRKGSVEIEGVTNVAIADLKQANRWYAKGKRARCTSWTNVNEASSRSHCLTRITIHRSRDKERGNEGASKLWMVDLGGSERLLKTGATGLTLDEGKAINLSLSALGDVIAALKWKRNHIPYRNSKLTQILSDSLGDHSKVLMIVHISPSADDVLESICSLSFAKRVRAIEPSRDISEESKKEKEKIITELNQQIHDAEEELETVNIQIEKIEKLVQEKKKLFPMDYEFVKAQKGSPKTPLALVHQEVTESPRNRKRTQSNSAPRFMASTACSRQRRCSVGEASSDKLRSLRSGSKGSVDFIGSRSLSHSDHNLKSNLRILKSTHESNISMNRRISTYHPKLRGTLQGHHRRRMSDLI